MLIGGVLGYVFRSKVIGTIEQEMRNTMRLYDKHDIHDAWDTTQRTVSYKNTTLLISKGLIFLFALFDLPGTKFRK